LLSLPRSSVLRARFGRAPSCGSRSSSGRRSRRCSPLSVFLSVMVLSFGLAVAAMLALAVAALLGLALLTAALDLLTFHAGESVLLPRPAAFALLPGGLVLAFLVLPARLVARLAAFLVPIGHRCSPLPR
jgi:hypothetical protein